MSADRVLLAANDFLNRKFASLLDDGRKVCAGNQQLINSDRLRLVSEGIDSRARTGPPWSPDGRLMALDAKSGAKLWEFQLGSAIDGPVISDELKGEQYIAVAAHSSVWALKLDGTKRPLPAQAMAPTVRRVTTSWFR